MHQIRTNWHYVDNLIQCFSYYIKADTVAGCRSSKGNHGNCLSHCSTTKPVTMDMTMWSLCKPHHWAYVLVSFVHFANKGIITKPAISIASSILIVSPVPCREKLWYSLYELESPRYQLISQHVHALNKHGLIPCIITRLISASLFESDVVYIISQTTCNMQQKLHATATDVVCRYTHYLYWKSTQ